jgi:hypothetical protein
MQGSIIEMTNTVTGQQYNRTATTCVSNSRGIQPNIVTAKYR